MSQVLDDHHALLFQLIQSLRAAIAAGSDRAVMIDLIERLLSYMVLHFTTETNLMVESNYPDLENHRKEHDAALAMVSWLEVAYRTGEPCAPEDTINFIEFWAQDHIPGPDARFEEFLKGKSDVAAA